MNDDTTPDQDRFYVQTDPGVGPWYSVWDRTRETGNYSVDATRAVIHRSRSEANCDAMSAVYNALLHIDHSPKSLDALDEIARGCREAAIGSEGMSVSDPLL